jgi:hypothetical protein
MGKHVAPITNLIGFPALPSKGRHRATPATVIIDSPPVAEPVVFAPLRAASHVNGYKATPTQPAVSENREVVF